MFTALIIIAVMLGLGLIFGFTLAFANKKLAVDVNPLVHLVEDVLPKGQCGACGYAGCMAYAEAVVLHAEVSPSLCIPGKEAVAEEVARLTGKVAEKSEPRIAHIKCAGTAEKAKKAYEYQGVNDCVAANMLHGGQKVCKYGCLGFGTCVASCPFGALTMTESGLPLVNKAKCTGCGKCESVCPKKVIEMISLDAKVQVDCNSNDKGALAKSACSVACIACTLCMKNCPYGAIKMVNNLAVVDQVICAEKCTDAVCYSKCPTKAIRSINKKEGV